MDSLISGLRPAKSRHLGLDTVEICIIGGSLVVCSDRLGRERHIVDRLLRAKI